MAVNGVPLYSPWDQAAVRNHTLDTGELDVCGGHAGRGDDYHYHIAPKCLIDTLGENHVDVAKLPRNERYERCLFLQCSNGFEVGCTKLLHE